MKSYIKHCVKSVFQVFISQHSDSVFGHFLRSQDVPCYVQSWAIYGMSWAIYGRKTHEKK